MPGSSRATSHYHIDRELNSVDSPLANYFAVFPSLPTLYPVVVCCLLLSQELSLGHDYRAKTIIANTLG